MKLSTFLQAFLLLDVFLAGAVAATAIRHGLEHFRPAKPETGKSHPAELSAATRERLLHEAEAHFQTSVEHSITRLQHDMDATATRINKLLEQMGTEVVGNELESYRTELTELRKQAIASVGGIQSELAKHEAELQAQLAQEITAEKQRLIQQIDTKLADAVGSFLIETLQHNVDLGAQSAYLTAMLEEHKADFIKGVADETPTS